jgi:hypothetical protein
LSGSSDRIGVARVGQAELARALVHLPDERGLRSRDALRESGRGVVGALQQERPQEIVDAHSLALAQVDLRLRGQRPVRRRRVDVGEAGLLERQQRGHQLGGAGHRARHVRVLGEEHLAVAAVDQDRRRRPR